MVRRVIIIFLVIIIFTSFALAVKVCPKCGTEYPDSYNFCIYCFPPTELVTKGEVSLEIMTIEGRYDRPISFVIEVRSLDYDSLESFINTCYSDGNISKSDFKDIKDIFMSIRKLGSEGKGSIAYINKVETLVDMSKKVVEKAETGIAQALALLLLGEIDYIRAESQHINDIEEYQRTLEYSSNIGIIEEPKVNFENTISALIQIILNYENFKYIDYAYYKLGCCLMSQEEYNEAAETLTKLIKKYPQSKYVQECYFRVGDYWFDKFEFDKAIDFYTKIDPKSPFYYKGLYKIGWCYYNLAKGVSDKNYINAFDAFLKLFDKYSNVSNPSLIREAKEFSVICISEYSAKPDPYILINLLKERNLEYLIPEELHFLGDLYLHKKDMSGIAAYCYKIILDNYPEYYNIDVVKESFNEANERIENK